MDEGLLGHGGSIYRISGDDEDDADDSEDDFELTAPDEAGQQVWRISARKERVRALWAARPVDSPSRITPENNGKIRPQPDRENAFARASGGDEGIRTLETL